MHHYVAYFSETCAFQPPVASPLHMLGHLYPDGLQKRARGGRRELEGG